MTTPPRRHEAPARVVLVDDHAIVRRGLMAILASEPTVEVVGEAADQAGALRAVKALRPDIVLLDVRLGADDDASSVELCRILTTSFSPVRVLMLSAFISERLVVESIRNGAKGYVLKDVDADALVKAVHAVRRGESAFDSHAAAMVVRSITGDPDPTDGVAALSERERDVLALVGRGLSNAEIGTRLYISATTVKFHLRNIMAKLGVHRRAELAFLVGQGERLDEGPPP